jgi:uncharacterized protein YciI
MEKVEITQYIYRIQPTRPEMLSEGLTEEESEATSDHYAYLKSLLEEGVLVLAGRTLNTDVSAFGIVILNANSEEEARQIVLNDPAVVRGVMNAELFPYRVALMGNNSNV